MAVEFLYICSTRSLRKTIVPSILYSKLRVERRKLWWGLLGYAYIRLFIITFYNLTIDCSLSIAVISINYIGIIVLSIRETHFVILIVTITSFNFFF